MKYETVELEVNVDELRVGMHVVRLDRPWSETDFLLQGFIIQSQNEIDALADQCRRVVIEGRAKPDGADESALLKKAEQPRFTRFLAGEKKRKSAKGRNDHKYDPATARKVGKATVTYINKVNVSHEIHHATSHYDSAKTLAKDIMSGLRVGRALDLNSAREVVDNCVDSILRNDDALMLLTKLKHRDEYTAEHSINVSILAAAFGKRLGLMESEIRTLGLCGLLHDIGKAKVPSRILQKPGALTPEEHEIIRKHPDWGRDMLMALPKVVHATIDVAYNHHERLDGKGDPRGLKAHQIPYFAKIMAIVDT